MKKVSKISNKAILLLVDFILLLIDILVFTYQTIRALILPTRRRKGNILSSLLSFFVGLLEKAISFEKSVLCQPVVFKHKYVKQVLVLAAGFLFLLSSLEWTVGPASASPVNEIKIVVAGEPSGDAVMVRAQVREDVFTPGYPFYKAPHPISGEPVISGGPVTVKRHILYCVFRI